MNSGKIFEQEIKDSITMYNKTHLNNVFFFRIQDNASGFGGSQNTRFTMRPPFDCFIYYRPDLYALELKSIGGTSISFDLEENNREIKSSQINELLNCGNYNINAGLLINFRKYEKTYYIPICSFVKYVSDGEFNKKSINIEDISKMKNVSIIEQVKKRTKYYYKICEFIKDKNDDSRLKLYEDSRQGWYIVFIPCEWIIVKIKFANIYN